MRVLVTGGSGFIGSAIAEALLAQGHTVLSVGRSQPEGFKNCSQLSYQTLNFNQATSAEQWQPLLSDIDAVVNCAGILREHRSGDFNRVHIGAPLALAEACVKQGIQRFVQISALGQPEEGEFIASKQRFDQQLLALMPTATVLRPSVVVSLRGSYGGSSMLRGLAAFPYCLVLPGQREQQIQPILLEDLAQLVLEAVERPESADLSETKSNRSEGSYSGIIEAGGPDVVEFKDYLRGLRQWLQIDTRMTLNIPITLVKLGCVLGDKLNAGPLNRTILSLLERGNTVTDPAPQQIFSYQPQSVLQAFQQQTSFVQDRWHARLFLLQPMIWFLLCVIWLLSAASGFMATEGQFAPILSAVGFPTAWHNSLVMMTSVLDLVLGVMLLLRYQERLCLWFMLLSTLGYSALLGVMAPGLWLDPLGGLLKNLAIAPLLLVYMVMRQAR